MRLARHASVAIHLGDYQGADKHDKERAVQEIQGRPRKKPCRPKKVTIPVHYGTLVSVLPLL